MRTRPHYPTFQTSNPPSDTAALLRYKAKIDGLQLDLNSAREECDRLKKKCEAANSEIERRSRQLSSALAESRRELGAIKRHLKGLFQVITPPVPIQPEPKPMAKSKAPTPKKDNLHVKGGGDAKPMPTKKRGVKAKVQGKGS